MYTHCKNEKKKIPRTYRAEAPLLCRGFIQMANTLMIYLHTCIGDFDKHSLFGGLRQRHSREPQSGGQEFFFLPDWSGLERAGQK